MTLREEQEIRATQVIRDLRGRPAYTAEQMQKDWEAAVAVAVLLADSPTFHREHLLEHQMTRVRAGIELGLELQKGVK